MSDRSKIVVTDATWNPVTGCHKISAGCDNCYAERFAERFRGVKGHPYEPGFDLTLRPERLEQPSRWQRPRVIFVNSMSDLFHRHIPATYIDQVFATMQTADWHIYQVLTKRSSLMRNYINRRYTDNALPAHIWLGVSVENRKALSRVRHLQQCNASVRYICVEPLLQALGDLDLRGIHWVIVGGETGPKARPIDIEWVRGIRDQCQTNNVALFFKQHGGYRPQGRLLDGREWLQFPTVTTGKPLPALVADTGLALKDTATAR